MLTGRLIVNTHGLYHRSDCETYFLDLVFLTVLWALFAATSLPEGHA